jgi:hypothetical protein
MARGQRVAKDDLVELMTAYLNPADQVNELRGPLARHSGRDAPADQPGIDTIL